MECIAAFVAAILNWADRSALFLALVVGLSVCIPLNPDDFTPAGWYFTLSVIDMAVVIIALLCGTQTGLVVSRIHAIMVGMHLFECLTNPYQEGFSLYAYAIPTLEMTSIAVTCFSAVLIEKGKAWNHGLQK